MGPVRPSVFLVMFSCLAYAVPAMITEAFFQSFPLSSGQQGSTWVVFVHSGITEKSAGAAGLDLGSSGPPRPHANHSAMKDGGETRVTEEEVNGGGV